MYYQDMEEFTIKITDSNSVRTLTLNDRFTQPIDWFVDIAQMSEKGETTELLKDGVLITAYVND